MKQNMYFVYCLKLKKTNEKKIFFLKSLPCIVITSYSDQ